MPISLGLFVIASLIAGTALLAYAEVLSDRMLDEINRVRSDFPVSRSEAYYNVFGTLALHKKLFPESRLRKLTLRVALMGYACFAFGILARVLR